MQIETKIATDIAFRLDEPLFSLEKHLLNERVNIESWFRRQWQKYQAPFYGSVDLRNAGFKIAPVDTNLFPAGFNNLNPAFLSLYVQAAEATIAELFPDAKRILLIPESHTRNLFYFESVAMLKELLTQAGLDVRVGSLSSEFTKPQTFHLPSGQDLIIEPIQRQGDRVGVNDFFPCCIILNNDLSSEVPDILQNTSQKIMPPFQLGWSSRLKSEHFRFYEQVANEFAEEMNFDAWLITPWFDQCPEVDFMKKEGEACLVRRAEGLLNRLQKKYQQYQIHEKPFIVIKADQGTYGMAVMMIREPNELSHLNRKQRTRMSTIKGGRPVTKAIIQEGVYTYETVGENRDVAEPVVYLLGRHVIGGFYRVHSNRGPDENLNAPGMNFHPLPFAQACNLPCANPHDQANQFYIYGIIARLALLAASRELTLFQRNKK